MSIPREPRQKMINMMYLVLTAMLALNVSAEILNAFKTVNRSLQNTNALVAQSTETVMKSLDKKRNDPSSGEKAKFWYEKAAKVQEYSSAAYNYIDALKGTIMKESKYDPNGTDGKGVDNLDVSTRLLVEKGGGKQLFQTLEDFKKNVLNVEPSITTEFQNTLPIDLSMPKTENKGNQNSWSAAYFRMVPTIATLTILSKFQNDIKTSENRIVTYCHSKVGEVVMVNDAYAALAIADANYVLPGQSINITAGVGGFNKNAKPQISIAGGKVLEVGADGTVTQKIEAGGIGTHSVTVHFSYKDQITGEVKTTDKKIEYTVGQSNAAVQLDKMNVLFIGVDNPVTISGSGSADQLKASMSMGQLIASGGGHYIAKVNQESDNCIISVTTPDGKVTPMKFRVRSIPDPAPMVGANESGDMPANVFKSQAGVRALVKNFFYETQFNVVSFRITGDAAGFEDGIEDATNTGAAWNEARKIINKARPGSFITIEDIRAIGPDNRTRKLTPLIFTLK